MLKKIAISLFILVSIFTLISVIFQIEDVFKYSKPLLMPSLILAYVANVNKISFLYILALGFSGLGDMLLMFPGMEFFVAGLAAFLLTHIIYLEEAISRVKKIDFKKLIYSIFPFMIIYLSVILFIKNSLGDLLFPVIVYGFVLSMLGTISYYSFLLKKNNKENITLFLGVSLFIISDSLLAIGKFNGTSHLLEILVMLTYIVAQASICVSVANYSKKERLMMILS